MNYCVYDPQPELSGEGKGPRVYVPKEGTWTREEAEIYANEMHPEDASGDTKVVQLVEADWQHDG